MQAGYAGWFALILRKMCGVFSFFCNFAHNSISYYPLHKQYYLSHSNKDYPSIITRIIPYINEFYPSH